MTCVLQKWSAGPRLFHHLVGQYQDTTACTLVPGSLFSCLHPICSQVKLSDPMRSTKRSPPMLHVECSNAERYCESVVQAGICLM